MIVGILSDSHGRHGTVSQAVRILREAGAEAFFHCGDVGGQAAFEELAGLRCWFVWGNMDTRTDGLRAFVRTLGLRHMDSEKGIELAGKRIGMWHGHERGFLRVARSNSFDYIFFGHTHVKIDTREGTTRLINPGALYRARVKTVATLNLVTDTLAYHVVEAR